MTLKLRGKAYYAQVGAKDTDPDEFGGREFYKLSLEMNDESWAKFSRSGLSLQSKHLKKDDEDSPLVVTFRRDAEAKTGKDKKGRSWSLGGGKPVVVDSDGDELDEFIGNGSEVEIFVEVYEAKKIKKKGHRLEKIIVHELVRYEPPEDEDDYEEEPVVETKKSSGKKKDLPF